MTLTSLILNIGIVALIFLAGIILGFKKHKNILMSFLQCFTGILFIFSGWVKAIDPMGTAFKMEQYFSEFESTFSQTFLSFISPLFPLLSGISIWFSVGMIIFEIVLGIMLLFGIRPKLTAWLFFLLVAFFTVLTGFTYLTGYVPSGVNFFDFGNWGPYKASNMKVTDCGCFGDFIKLEPRTSFFKDVALLIPAVYFLFKHKLMHTLFSEKKNNLIMALSTLALLGYCLFNFVWNEPHIDFRPFKNGANIAQKKAEESKALAAVHVTAFMIKNKKTGAVTEVPYAQYDAEKEKYSDKATWEVIDQIKTTPAIPRTKVSDFEITDFDGVDSTDLFLGKNGKLWMITAPKVKFSTQTIKMMVKDSVTISDTTIVKGKSPVIKQHKELREREVSKTDFIWPASFINDIKLMKPAVDAGLKAGDKVAVVIGGISKEAADDLAQETGIKATYLTADDILLKTIMRSNPGLVLWQDGTIVQKWHKNHLPK
jgi:uncharacterized membrane protein YphA (DoxX/SURF4 family)